VTYGSLVLNTIPIDTMAGGSTTLAEYGGTVLLIVNVASKCGLTPQYEGLQSLHATYRDQGFEVLGFPANDFLDQEPGSNDEIIAFCHGTYAVEFPVFAKITVSGPDKHPLYASLTTQIGRASGDPDRHRERLRRYGIPANEDPEVLWNFEKFLVSRDGVVVGRFAPAVTPGDRELVAAIERELSRATPAD
jgi:glutathione peroxidase